MPLMQFVGNLGYVAVSILGGYLAIKKTIEVGQIQSFLQYVRNFSQPITQLAQVGNMMQTTAAVSYTHLDVYKRQAEPILTINPEESNAKGTESEKNMWMTMFFA